MRKNIFDFVAIERLPPSVRPTRVTVRLHDNTSSDGVPLVERSDVVDWFLVSATV